MAKITSLKRVSAREQVTNTAIKYFASKGYEVYVPVSDNHGSDLLVREGMNVPARSVKVITSIANMSMKGGKSGASYSRRSYAIRIDGMKEHNPDLICFIVCPDSETFVIPASKFTGNKLARFGLDSKKYISYKVTV